MPAPPAPRRGSLAPLMLFSTLLVLVGLVVGLGEWARPYPGHLLAGDVSCGPALWPTGPDAFDATPAPDAVDAPVCAYLQQGHALLAVALLVPGLLGVLAPMVLWAWVALSRRPPA